MQIEAFERSSRAFARRTPFEPFAVELVSGSRLEVNHPKPSRSTVGGPFTSLLTERQVCSTMIV